MLGPLRFESSSVTNFLHTHRRKYVLSLCIHLHMLAAYYRVRTYKAYLLLVWWCISMNDVSQTHISLDFNSSIRDIVSVSSVAIFAAPVDVMAKAVS